MTRRSPRVVVGATMAAAFIAMMDSSIINVALYSIGADLDASTSELGLMISGYVLCYGLFLVCGGRLGDIHGHRRVFVVGVAAFTAASALCGLAPTAESLIVLRCVQGLAAALFFPQVLSIVHTSLRGADRERALGLFGLVIGLAGVVGQVVTGLVVQLDVLGMAWRPVFLINVPIGLAVIVGAVTAVPRRSDTGRSRIDAAGGGLLALGMLLCVFPLAEGRSLGWPLWCVAMLGLAVPVLAAFFAWERRLAARGGQPLAHPGLWRLPGYRLGTVVLAVLLSGNAAFFFVMVVQVQGEMGYSPLAAGLLLTPHAVAFGISSVVARRLAARVGSAVLAVGCGLNVLGFVIALVAVLAAERPDGAALIPALVVAGVGQGLGVVPLLGRTLAEVAPEHAGAASGVLETAIQLGISVGITLMGLVYFAARSDPGSTSGAFAVSVSASLAVAVVPALLVPALLRPARAGATAGAG